MSQRGSAAGAEEGADDGIEEGAEAPGRVTTWALRSGMYSAPRCPQAASISSVQIPRTLSVTRASTILEPFQPLSFAAIRR